MAKKSKSIDNIGLSNKAPEGAQRQLNRDGTFNIKKSGIPAYKMYDIYHSLITISWFRFSLLVLAFYLIMNLIFSGLYLLIGIEQLEGIRGESTWEQFLDAFFFSSQTITTLGYGRISPTGTPANVIAAFESMIGLLGFALATGLLYGRFSRPLAKILYSDFAIIAPYHEITGLMFRVANLRPSQLIEAEAELILSYYDIESKKRSFTKLELEISKINFLSMSWTIVHPITSESILWQKTKRNIQEMDLELIIMIKAFDDTFSQSVYSRSSYKYHEIEWGKKFSPITSLNKEKKLEINLGKINQLQD